MCFSDNGNSTSLLWFWKEAQEFENGTLSRSFWLLHRLDGMWVAASSIARPKIFDECFEGISLL